MSPLKTHPEVTIGWHCFVAGLLIGTLVGACGMHRYMTGELVPEKPAAEIRQADGSLILERKPDAHAKAAQIVPQGDIVERVGSITVKPHARPANAQALQAAADNAAAPDCPPVHIDYSLVREADGSRRVIASSPDGDIVGGVDVPIESMLAPPAPHKWAAGGSYGLASQAYGVWAERDLWRLRFGVEANRTRVGDVEGRLRIGITF